LPPPVIESFVASSETIASGASVLLTAVFQGSGVISGIGPVSSGVSVATPALNTTTQFALIVGNGDGPEARITLQVDVVGPPTIQSLSASPAAIGIGGSSTLRWSVGGSISTARLDPPGIDVMGAASIVVTPEVTTTYVLNLANELGETVSASVQVEVAPPTFIESFSATPAVSTPGGTVILAARFQGSGTLEREDNGFYTTIGPIASGATISSGELLRSTDFRLRVTNAAGMVVTQNLAVPVIGPGTFQPARGQPIAPLRVRHTATRLADGRVFIAGGQAPVGGETNTTELYDPATETFTAGPNLIEARFLHSATLLADGRVLIAGGTGIGFQNERLTVEIFDPAKGSVRSVARLPGPAQFFPSQALSLPDGRVAIESSMSGTPSVRGVAIFDPSNDSLGEFILFANPYSGVQSVERLPDGRGLFIRGNNQSEIFQPGSNSFAFTAAATNPRGIDFATAVLGDGRVLLTGGTVDPSTPAEVYDPVTGTFEVVGVQRFFARRYGRAVTLASGKTLVVGGGDVQLGTPWAELFDPVAGTFSATGGLRTGRWSHTATLLDDGRVLVVGGCSGLPCDAELYKP
jgi:hypothetical protein